MNQQPYQHVRSYFSKPEHEAILQQAASATQLDHERKESARSFTPWKVPQEKPKEEKPELPEIQNPYPQNPSDLKSVNKTINFVVRYHDNCRVLHVKSPITMKDLTSEIKKEFGIDSPITCYQDTRKLRDPLVLDSSMIVMVLDATHDEQEQETYTIYKPEIPTLTLPNYSISPPLRELKTFINSELEAVPNVVIELPGVGKIEWEEPVNLRGVNLDEIINMERTKDGFSTITVILSSFSFLMNRCIAIWTQTIRTIPQSDRV